MYAYSYDGVGFVGKYNHPEEAAFEAFDYDTDIERVWVGEIIHPNISYFVPAKQLIEELVENLEAEYGEYTEGYLDEVLGNVDDIIELQSLVAKWILSKESTTFFGVKDVKKYTRADVNMVDTDED